MTFRQGPAVASDGVDPDVGRLVEHFGLEMLPVEGTWFANTYRSPVTTAAGGPVGTAMVGLYSADPPSHSRFHRLVFDEVWHFYRGDPMRLVLLHRDGSSEDVILGHDLAAGHRVQRAVPAGVWQAGELAPGGRWALFGCTMAPGFTGACFEGGFVDDLLVAYPGRADDVRRLGIPNGDDVTMPPGYQG